MRTVKFVFACLAIKIVHVVLDELTYPFGKAFGGFQPLQYGFGDRRALGGVFIRIPVRNCARGLADVVQKGGKTDLRRSVFDGAEGVF